MYLKKLIIYEVSDSVCTNDIELCMVKISISGNKKQILITAYRPPGGNVAKAVDTLCLDNFPVVTINGNVLGFVEKY